MALSTITAKTKITASTLNTIINAVNAIQTATPNAYITKTYVSGTQGYRKWSDGFIEQWGRASGTAGVQTASLPTSFTTTNYHVSVDILQTGLRRWAFPRTVTTTNFTYCVNDYAGEGSATSTFWYACGY